MAAQPKTIVISDIHMGNGKPYSWFQPPDSKELTGLLNAIADGAKNEFQNIKELVILGDLFDLWLYPVTEKPWPVEEIVAANEPVRKALQRCVGRIPVYYMGGNHDMGVRAKDLQPFSSGGNKIILTTTRTYKKRHQGWHFEHGHLVDMFNAPDRSPDTIGGYPLGYFITRLTARADPSIWQQLKKLYQDMHYGLYLGGAPKLAEVKFNSSALVNQIIDEILPLVTGVDASTEIEFQPPLSKTYTVGDIKTKYRNLYARWHKKYGEDTLNTMLASRHFVGLGLIGLGGLEWYAKRLLSASDKPKVVVMGHTHRSRKHGVYSNDGCCCGAGCLSYVEIVGNSSTVKYWP
jgi:predicted phosphodiesterase